MFRFVAESRRDSESRGRKSLLAWHLNGVGDPEGMRSWLATQLNWVLEGRRWRMV